MSLVRFRLWAFAGSIHRCLKVQSGLLTASYICGCSSMVEHQPSKLDTWVRFPSPASKQNACLILYRCLWHTFMREWLSGGAPPCQGGGRGFDPRLALFFFKLNKTFIQCARVAQRWSTSLPRRGSRVRSPSRAFIFPQYLVLVLGIFLCYLKIFKDEKEDTARIQMSEKYISKRMNGEIAWKLP